MLLVLELYLFWSTINYFSQKGKENGRCAVNLGC